jgi:outer membrane protein TolC
MKKIYILLFFNLFIAFNSKGQDSMIGDVSYLYLEKLIATAKSNYPQMKSNDYRINVAKANVNKQKVSWLDPLSVSYYYRESNTFDIVNPALFSGYQFGVSLSPGTFLQKPSNIRQAREELNIAKSEQRQYELSLETQIKTLYFSYIRQINVLKVSSKSLMDIESVFKSVKTKYERGEVTFEEYNNALIAVSSGTIAKMDAEAGMLTAKAAIEELIGKRLEEVK